MADNDINFNSSEPVYYGGVLPEVVKFGQKSASNIKVFPEGTLNKSNTDDEIISSGVANGCASVVDTNMESPSPLSKLVTSLAKGKNIIEVLTDAITQESTNMINNIIDNIIQPNSTT